MSVTKEKNLEAMKSLILENKDFGVKEIVNILNNLGFRKDNGLPWQYSSLYSFICTHLKDFKHDIKTRIIKGLNELELDITNTSIIKDSKEIYQENLLAINKVILNNQDKTLSEIAGILNTFGYKTKRGVDWDLNKVNYHMIAILQLTPRKKAGTVAKESYENYDDIFKIISECKNLAYPRIAKILNEHNLKTKRGHSWNDQTVRVFLSDELNINKSTDMARFEKNILNQLEKIEPKVIPEIETEIEIVPNYEIKDLVFEKEGKFFTDSLMVSSIFEKEHSKVLDSIKKILETGEIDDADFSVISYQDKIKRTQYKYLISKNGFALLGMGFTGDKALKFKIAYIKQFNKMEEALKNKQQSIQIQRELSTLELMEMTSKTFREQETKILSQIKKETTEALETQKKEIDIKLQELDKKISSIPTVSQPTEQLSFIQGNTKLINISEKMQSKAHKEDDLFKATKDLIYKYSVKSKKDEWDIYPLLYKTFKHSTGIYLEKEKNIYNKQFLVAERISTIKYAQLKGHIPELHQIMTNLYNNLILESKEG